MPKICENVTRFEVIDKNGRSYSAYGVEVKLQLQDDGKTLKAFLKRRSPAPAPYDPLAGMPRRVGYEVLDRIARRRRSAGK